MGLLTFTCRGPVLGRITQAMIDDGHFPPGALGHNLRGVVRNVITEPGKIGQDAEGKPVAVPPETTEIIEPCGNDLTELANTVPVDGQTYEITCPACGAVARVTHTPLAPPPAPPPDPE